MSPIIVDKVAKRKDILRCAMTVCARQGVHDFKMIDIAHAAQVGKGTLYEYFTDKDDLVSGCFELFLDDYNNYLSNRLSTIVDPREKIETMIKGSLEFFVQNHDNMEIMFDFWASSVRNKDDQAILDGAAEGFSLVIADVGGIIKEGVKQGVFRPVDPRLAASMLLALLDGLCLQSVMGIIKLDRRGLPQKISRVFLEGILK